MPRKRKGFGRRLRQRRASAPADLCQTSNRPSKRKYWTNEQMQAALSACSNGVPVKKAAAEYGVPTTTLRDRITGRVVHGTKPGPKPYLSSSEETELSHFLKTCTDIGYGKTRKDVMSIAQSVAADKGVLKSHKITEGWWRRFLKRQPDLSLRRGDTTAHIRMNAVNRDTMKQYFALLNEVMSEHNLHTKPSQIYNVDESGIPFDPKPPNIVTKKGMKKVRYRSSGRKGQVTIVGCASASGHAIPPMVIFDAQKLNPSWTEGEFPGTKYGLSSNGWINTELFEAWLSEHVLEHAVSARPLLLLLDGHSTHYQPQLLRLAREHDVIILCLPPHTTHEAQPLDCGVFGPLKAHWSNVCHSFLQQNPGRVITRFQFSSLFSEAWGMAVTPSNIIAGFRTCGVYPFNPSAIQVPDVSAEEQTATLGLPVSHFSPSSADNLSCLTSYASSCNAISGPTSHERAQNPFEASVCSLSPVRKPSGEEFTAEQLRCFEIHYEEGFNVFTDSDYVKWLELHHPESLPKDRYALIPVNDELTLADHFSSVSPAVATEVVCFTQPSPAITPNSSEESQDDSPISKYLTLPPGATPSIPKTLPQARLLTSADAMAQLEEKERKKTLALEEKERRKTEREEKKQQKEEEQRRKAKEREKKAEQRAKKAKKASDEKSRKVTCKTRNKGGECSHSKEPQRKKHCKESCADSDINTDVCCMCFGLYSEGVVSGDSRDWIECACGRWLHEECAEDREVDANGKERFCPSCLC